MATTSRLPIQEAPDLRNTPISLILSVDDTATDAGLYFFYCEKDTVVDHCRVTWSSQDASSPASITLMNAGAAGIASATALSNTLAVQAIGTINTGVDLTLTDTDNVIPAGNWIAIDIVDGDSSSAGQGYPSAYLGVYLRLRTIIA